VNNYKQKLNTLVKEIFGDSELSNRANFIYDVSIRKPFVDKVQLPNSCHYTQEELSQINAMNTRILELGEIFQNILDLNSTLIATSNTGSKRVKSLDLKVKNPIKGKKRDLFLDLKENQDALNQIPVTSGEILDKIKQFTNTFLGLVSQRFAEVK